MGKLGRRSRRSRRLIVDALLELLTEQRYDRITVREIIERADVGRSTFYARFRSKEDVLEGEFERVLGLLHEEQLATGGMPADHLLPALGLFRHVHQWHRSHPNLFRGVANDVHAQMVHRQLRDHLARQLAARDPGTRDPAVPPDIIADHAAGALLGLVRWWLDHGLPHPPEQMAAFFRQLAMPGIRAAMFDPETMPSAVPASHASPR